MDSPEYSIKPATILAAELYMTDRHNLTFAEVSRLSGIPVAHLKSEYPVMADLLRGYYLDAWQRYLDMESAVPEFGNYTLAEKLATLVFSYCDELEAVEGFATETSRLLLVQKQTRSALESGIGQRVEQYLASDDHVSPLVKYIPAMNLGRWIRAVTTWLIKERIADSSPDKEQSSALTDKACTLIQSLAYTGTIDHAVDFFKYFGMTYKSKAENHE